MPERIANKAARLMVIWELRRTGQLQNYNKSEIARLFDVNRSTILRDLLILDEVDKLLPEMRDRWLLSGPPTK